MKYLKNLLISLDQFGNALSGGDPDEVLSSVAAKFKHLNFVWWLLYHLLELIDPGHGKAAMDAEKGEGANRSLGPEAQAYAFLLIIIAAVALLYFHIT
jgi:hypothetical protein